MTFISYLFSFGKRQVYLYEILSLALAISEIFIHVLDTPQIFSFREC